MFTVRFPTGVSVRYNDANYAVSGEGWSDLYTKKDGVWIARVLSGSGAIIESVRASRVENPVVGVTNEASIARVNENIREMPTNMLASLKRLLRGFNSKTHRWT